jgi:thiosulfate dehydrogenase (quinone) large subunit
MEPSTPTLVDMSHPSRWLAVLRVVVGMYFLKALWSKMDVVFLGGLVPWLGVEPRWIETMPALVSKHAEANPFPFYKQFLEQTVLPHAVLYAKMTAWGETLVGLSMVSGTFAGLGVLGAFWLSLNYGLSSQHLSPASYGFHYMLLATTAVLFLARSGRALGVDAWLAWRWPDAWFTRRPLA